MDDIVLDLLCIIHVQKRGFGTWFLSKKIFQDKINNSQMACDGTEISGTGQAYGVPAVGGLKFSMAQQKVQKSASWGSASWGKCQLGEVLVGGRASWGKC